MELPFTSIIVLNYNGKHHLKECFDSIYDLNYPPNQFEVILVDNHSSDGSIDYIKKSYSWVKILSLDKNYGFSQGNNKGVEISNCKFIVFLNNDTVVDRNWLIELVTMAMNDDNIAVCASKMLFYDRPTVINHAGGIISLIGGGIDIGLGNEDNEKYNIQSYIGFACGGSMLIKKSVFIEIGGFDNDYFAYNEDVDIGFKCWIYGYKCVYAPKSIIYHKGSGSWNKESHSFKLYNAQVNRLQNIVKNFEVMGILYAIPLSVLFDLVRCLYNPSISKAIIKGYYNFIKELPKSLEKRRHIQANRKISDSKMYKMGLIASLNNCIKEYHRVEKLK